MIVIVEWGRVAAAAGLGLTLACLYAVLLSTPLGRAVCERRTHWTVIWGHVLMAATMALVSPALAGLWLLWSVVHGLPLVVRSEMGAWRDEDRVARGAVAAMRGILRMLDQVSGGNDDEAGNDRGVGDGYGESGAGDDGC